MRTFLHAALVAASMAGGTLLAQQPAPVPQPRQGAPEAAPPQGGGRMDGRRGGPMDGRRGGPMGGGMERRGPEGFRMMIYSPTALLERREALNLTPDQVTKLSTLENDLRTAREKAQADSKPHREELDKLWQQGAPDVTQIRTHTQALMQVEQSVRLSAVTSTASAKAALTPEQRGRVQGWAEARMAERGRGRGMMFRRPSGGPGRGPGGEMPGPQRRPAGYGIQQRQGNEL